MSALCEGVDCRQIGALCIISLNIRMTGDTQPPPARARRVAEGLLPLYMSIRSKRPTGSGVRRRLISVFFIYPKKWFLSSRKYDPGCSSQIPDPDPDFLPIPDPGSWGKKGTGSWIRIRNTEDIKRRSFCIMYGKTCADF